MHSYLFRNVSEALYVMTQDIESRTDRVETRNGPAFEFSGPVGITYSKPVERVLFYPQRDANPFFHCMEALWMLAGRNDVEFVGRYNKRISSYSTNGKTFEGAYGYRWRRHFGYDQLKIARRRLTSFENDRRTVVSMWDATGPVGDLQWNNDAKDIPCNTHIYFSIRDQALHMTVCNRSNDLIWGSLGANFVHMTMLMEYMATACGVKMGHYTQFTNNLHAYESALHQIKGLQADYEPYLNLGFNTPLVQNVAQFDEEVVNFCSGKRTRFQEPFLELVAVPMADAWEKYKEGDFFNARLYAGTISSADWRKACTEWLQRKENKNAD